MIEKKAYLNRLLEMGKVFKKYDFLNNSVSQCEQLKELIDDFAFRVVLVGGFSSGKSAFLNRLTGRQIFKEELGPETAIPAEVSWAPTESCEAVFEDGSRIKMDIETATANPPEGTRHFSIHLENQFLKQRPELILVDFPGYDSNLEAHNAAITGYLKKGSAFLLFIPVQNGALTTTDIKFIKEAAAYPQALACVISKTDVRPPEKCSETTDYIRRGISMYYGADVPVTQISIMPDYIADFEERVAAMVDGFNPQTLFNLSFAPAINEQINAAVNALDEYIEASQLDFSDLDSKINASQEAVSELARQLEKERVGLDKKYQFDIIPAIMRKLENAFQANIQALAEAALVGGQRFGDVAQSIARPILAGIPGEIQANLRDIISNMRITPTPQSPENNNLRDAMLNIVDVISTFIPTAKGKKFHPHQVVPLPGMGTGVLVAMLGNPVLGAVIALAPTFINLLFGGQRQPQGPDPLQNAKVQIESQGIPAILQRLETAIIPAVMETRDMMFKEIEQKIRESQKTAELALKQAKSEKDCRQNDFSSNRQQIQADINTLRGLLIQAGN